MRFLLKFALFAALLAVGYCLLFSCTSLQGEHAPPLTGGSLILQGQSVANEQLPNTDWRLLAFFSPG